MMDKQAKIYIAGHRGLVGSALVRKLKTEGYSNLIVRAHTELDLTNQTDVAIFFETEKPDYVFLAAAKVGGILANKTYPADFMYSNLQIQNNIINQSYIHKVKKLLFLGSSCIYPRNCPQPIKEDYLLTSELEPSNEPYAVAKISGIKMCQAYNRQFGTNFISVMPTNLYGPNDNYDLNNSHVLPALIRKFYEAVAKDEPIIKIWGTGKARREFLHVDDLADACVMLMNNYDNSSIINIGSGLDLKISELVDLIANISGYKGQIVYNHEMPDGTPQKLLLVDKLLALGWAPKINLEAGLKKTYQEYAENIQKLA